MPGILGFTTGRVRANWSPGWDVPPAELKAVKETFRHPGVLTAALNYYRHLFDPPDDPSRDAYRDAYGGPIPVAALHIHGERDGGVGVENTEGMEDWFPNGLEKRIIPGAGHFVHQERPAEVNHAILDFLGVGP